MNAKLRQFLLWFLTVSSLIVAASCNANLNDVTTKEALSSEAAIAKIKNKEFKEANFKPDSVDFIDQNGAKFVTTVVSDSEREALWDAVQKAMSEKPNSMIVTEGNY